MYYHGLKYNRIAEVYDESSELKYLKIDKTINLPLDYVLHHAHTCML